MLPLSSENSSIFPSGDSELAAERSSQERSRSVLSPGPCTGMSRKKSSRDAIHRPSGATSRMVRPPALSAAMRSRPSSVTEWTLKLLQESPAEKRTSRLSGDQARPSSPQ